MTATIDDQRTAATGTPASAAVVDEREVRVLLARLHATMDRLQQLDPTWLGDAGLVDIVHDYVRFVRRTPSPLHTLVGEVGAAASPPRMAPGR